jgi:Fic family protein
MLFAAPNLTTEEEWVLEHVEDLRRRLSARTREPRLWVGMLRRVSLARAIQGSNSIEGYNVSIEDAMAAEAEEEPMRPQDETWRAILGYRAAMNYVLQLSDDLHFELDATLIRSLHYMLQSYDPTKSPGRWRLGPIYVQREGSGEIVYTGPDAEQVPGLVNELVVTMRDSTGPALIRAAMAHLNLVMIHPFRDGNGRMARILQSMVLTRDGVLTPDFCSIEEHLGRNTPAYYDVLAEVGQGSWHPERDARAWIRFCLTAHYRQARTLLRRTEESELRWNAIERLVHQRGLHARSIPALFNAAMGYRIRNATYRSLAEDVSELVASRDLRALVDAGILQPEGGGRGRTYTRTDELNRLERSIRIDRPQDRADPFEVATEALRAQTVPIWPDEPAKAGRSKE